MRRMVIFRVIALQKNIAMEKKPMDVPITASIVNYDRTEDLTIEEVRQFEKYRDYSEYEIKALIATFKAFSRIVFNLCRKGQNVGRNIALHIDNQQTKAA